jgi:hypothetical protein
VDFNVTGLPAGATVTPTASLGPGEPSVFSIQTSGDTPAGSWPITITGTSGNLTHSAQVQLNVHTGVPIVWFGGPAGHVGGSTDPNARLYLSTDPAGSQNVESLDILFNDRIDGRHACWIYFNGMQPWLASDDGTAWTRIPGGPGIAENSQCTANYGGIVGNGYFGVVLTVTFKPGFAPSNVYEDAVNKQGGNSGYQIVNGANPTTPWSN